MAGSALPYNAKQRASADEVQEVPEAGYCALLGLKCARELFPADLQPDRADGRFLSA